MNEITKFRILSFSGYFGIAALGTMTIPFLLYKGFTPSQVGIIAAFFTLSGFLSNYIIGYLCDRFGTIKLFFRLSVAAAMFFLFILTFIQSKVLFIFIYILLGFFQSAVMNLCDSWVIEYNGETRAKYGVIRSFGSIGWSLCSLLIGYLIMYTGFYAISIVYIGMFIGLMLISRHIQDSQKEPCHLKLTDVFTLFSLPNYTFFILCLFIYGVAHASISYIPQYLIKDLGGSTGAIGLFSFICAGSEIIILSLSVYLLSKRTAEQLFLYASIGLLIRLVCMYFATSVTIVLLTGILHMFTFGTFLISTRRIIDTLTPPHLKTTGQMLWSSVFGGLGMIISSTLSGFLIQSLGIQHTILFFTSISFLASTFIYAYNKRIGKRMIISEAS